MDFRIAWDNIGTENSKTVVKGFNGGFRRLTWAAETGHYICSQAGT